MNTFKCKICADVKVKVQKGTFTDPRNKRYVDEHDKQWSGKVCPDCHRTRTAISTKNRRANRVNNV